MEPYFTLRGHTGPLLAMTGANDNSASDRLLFTAGIEGSIRVWNAPALSEVNVGGDTYEGKNYCIGVWTDSEQEAFWDIKYHPFQDLLLSINAQNSVLIWDCKDLDLNSNENNGHIAGRFSYKQTVDVSLVPTSCTWLCSQHN